MDGFFSPSAQVSESYEQAKHCGFSDISAQIAFNNALRREAFKIRHAGYHHYGYINQNLDGIFSDKYDNYPNSITTVIYKGNKSAGTVRVCMFDIDDADNNGIPAMEIFSDEVFDIMNPKFNSYLPEGARRVVEVTRMARLPEFANDSSVLQAIFRVVGYLVLHYKPDIVLNACRIHHVPIYKRFGFTKIHSERKYPNLNYKACLMAYFSNNFTAAKDNLMFLRGISEGDLAYLSLLSGGRIRLNMQECSAGLIKSFSTQTYQNPNYECN